MQPKMIAERVVYGVHKNGRVFEIGLQIGRPYETDTPNRDWACPVALIGLHGRFPDMYGVDSLQALSLALRLTRRLLEYFVEDGGKLLREPGGEAMTVDEVYGDISEPMIPDGPLTPEQEISVSQLTSEDFEIIDSAIIRNCSHQFRKIARVVGSVITDNTESIPDLPDVFIARRIRQLIAHGKLESQGNITAMRFGEIKLP